MIQRPKLWLSVSALSIVLYLIIIVTFKPVIGIDFIGGSLLEIKTTALDSTQISQLVTQQLASAATVQTTETNTFLIRTGDLPPSKHDDLLASLRAADATLEELRFENVGPTIGAELRRKAWVAISISIIVIIMYLAYEFRHTGGLVSSWKFGIAAAAALVHDLLFVTAVFALLGKLFGAPIDALFVTAMLALGGYSVNDTIVLFNRFKQEWLATRTGTLIAVMDRAVKLTLIRSLNTSIPILLTLLTLLFFGGPTIRWFIAALTAGTITGAYSTIFVAPAILHYLARARR